jgi:hypothetical protein
MLTVNLKKMASDFNLARSPEALQPMEESRSNAITGENY